MEENILFRARKFKFEFPRPAMVMGVINITPDSFYVGGRFPSTEQAVEHAFEMVEQGADIIDIGGESTFPGAQPVDEKTELGRVLPAIEKLTGKINVPISIDTIKPAVAGEAVAAGASIINDVAANREDSSMWEVVSETGVGYIVNHMQGTPQTMQLNPVYTDLVKEINEFFKDRIKRLKSLGVNEEQIVLDPGIGFGKTVEHNLQILKYLIQFKQWGRPIMIGVSRKTFIGKILNVNVESRLAGSLACAAWAVLNGVNIIRAHDVTETMHTIKMVESIVSCDVKS